MPALALPTGSITSHDYSVIGTGYTKYVYIDVESTVNNFGSTTAYVEVANQLRLTYPGQTDYYAWNYGTAPAQYTLNPGDDPTLLSRFRQMQAVRGYLYVSDARLAASEDQPYTGGIATILDEDQKSFRPVP